MKKYKFLAFLLLTLITSFAITEYQLRKNGFIPGVLAPRIITLKWFDIFSPKPLHTSQEFIADDNGLLIFNRGYFDTCSACLKGKLYSYLKNTKTNKWGYRDINNTNKTGLNIMLLGDALTWGFSAMPIDSSFADILSNKQYRVYDFGIPGTDIIQHEAIARKYLDTIHPDIVILNFYAGHDFIDYDKKIIPHKNIDYFLTDHFWFPVSYYKNGDSVLIFDSELDAQNYYFEDITFGKYCHNPIHRILGKTVITTYLGRYICGRDDLDSRFTKRKYEDKTIETLLRIVKYCSDRKVDLIISVIPNRDGRNQDRTSVFKNRKELNGILSFPILQDYDYMEGADDNLNNRGHRKYAEYLDSIIQKYHSKY